MGSWYEPIDKGPVHEDPPKTRRAARKTKKHPHECRTPAYWWKTRIGRSWVCPECRRRWRIVAVKQDKQDIRGRNRPVWEKV